MLRFILLASLLVFPSASAAFTKAPAPQQANAAGYVLSGMPLVRQTYNACGPASIMQVLAYYGIQKSLSQVSKATRATERSYMTAQAIVNYAPSVGMEARLYAGGSLQTVRQAIVGRLPLIVLQSHITPKGTVIPHWRVVVGYDDAREQVYLMDPLLGYILMSYQDFNRVWADHRGQFAALYPASLKAQVSRILG